MMVLPAGCQQRLEGGDIARGVALGIELHRPGGHQQQRGVRVLVAQRGPQPDERLAQIVERRRLGLVRPEQAGERFAALGAAGVQDQIDEERPHLIRAEGGDRLSIHGGLQRAEHG